MRFCCSGNTKKLIVEEEGDEKVLIPAAILHDIGIKECEKKYNSVSGHLQEKEGPSIAKKILNKINYPNKYISEILEIIGNHHSPNKLKTDNFQLLYESDWLVNLFEPCYNRTALNGNDLL